MEKSIKRYWPVFILPTMAAFMIGFVVPFLEGIYLSFCDFTTIKDASFVGLENYAKILSDSRAGEDIMFTLKFTIATVALELIIGFAAALIMNRAFKGRGLVRAAILVPWAIPTSVSAMMWKFIYNDQYGMFNDILYRLGIIDGYKAWLSTRSGSFMAMVITDVWKTAPYMALLLLAGLQVIDEGLYEAAKIDGCTFFQTFYKIILPVLKPILATVALLSFRGGWNEYILPLVFTMTDASKRPLTVGVTMLKNAGDGAAAWNIMFAGATIAIVPILVIYIFASKYFINGMTAGAVKG
mgnify:CR=1 FL=1